MNNNVSFRIVSTSETSVDNHFTRQYIPEDNSEHHTRRRENLKSHNNVSDFTIECENISLVLAKKNMIEIRVTSHGKDEKSVSIVTVDVV
jgi:hypothetical protein